MTAKWCIVLDPVAPVGGLGWSNWGERTDAPTWFEAQGCHQFRVRSSRQRPRPIRFGFAPAPAFWKHAWKHSATSSPQPKPECPRSFGMHRTTRCNLFPDRSAQTAIRSVADSATDAATGSASAEWCEPGNQRLDASMRRRISSRLRVRTPWQPLCMLYARRTRYLQRPYLQRTSTSS